MVTRGYFNQRAVDVRWWPPETDRGDAGDTDGDLGGKLAQPNQRDVEPIRSGIHDVPSGKPMVNQEFAIENY